MSNLRKRRPIIWGLLQPGTELVSKSKPMPTDDKPEFGHNPFQALSSDGLPPGRESPPTVAGRPGGSKSGRKSRGRVDIIRQKAGRGGKTVTVVKGFIGISLAEKEHLTKTIQKTCGTGGTIKNGQIEIHGDKRSEVARILSEAGFTPVLAGG
jgi:translation initiation factor 1